MTYFFFLWEWVLKKNKKDFIDVIYQLTTRAEINFSYNFVIFQENFQITYLQKISAYIGPKRKMSNFAHQVNTNQLFFFNGGASG